MANTHIKIKRTTTTGINATPVDGEISYNMTDKRLFMSNATTTFDAVQNVANTFTIFGTTQSLKVGNSTVNSTVNSTSIKILNSTSNALLTLPSVAQWSATNYFLHANGSWTLVNALATAPGSQGEVLFHNNGSISSNAFMTWDRATGIFALGNSTANSWYHSLWVNTPIVYAQTRVETPVIYLGSNIVLTTTYISLGNTTVNTQINSTVVNTITLYAGNSTVYTSINSTVIGGTSNGIFNVANATQFNAGANVKANTIAVQLGNSTINLVVNSTAVKLMNSTSNTTLSVPSAAAYAATNYFLHANGSWVQVTAGGGSVSKYSANVGDGSSTTITITHNLNSLDVIIQVYRQSGSYDTILVDQYRPNTNSIQLVFDSAPSSNAYRVVVIG